jgi:hypothetical protein
VTKLFTDAQIAEMAYELHRGYNHVIDDPWVDPPWPGLPRWHQEAVIDGVRAARQGKNPREMHENWCGYYTRRGWKFGPAKDPAARTHPDLVSWEDLEPPEQLKNVLFTGIVRFLLRI